MKRLLALSAMFLMVSVATAMGQQPSEDPIAQNLFPPELVMKHAGEIGLDERQRAAIKEAIQKAQAKFLDAQWDLQSESEKMARLLQAKRVDEAAVLAQVDKVLALEREVKRAQLSLLIRIKNLLTEPQQAKLMELRKKSG